MRNRATSVLLAVVCLAICLSACASGPRIPVVSVSEILGIGPIGMYNRYAGVIEAGETVSVNKDASLEVAEVAVQAGDAVTKGQVLFSYETAALGIAYLYTNEAHKGIAYDDSSFITTIDAVEELAGIDFFHNVPPEIQNAAERSSTA